MMLRQHLIQVGRLGRTAPYAVPAEIDYDSRTRVLCHTPRGLEVGEVLVPLDPSDEKPEGSVLRAITAADEPHLGRIELQRDSAYRTCRQWLLQRRLTTLLVDAELLFDDQSLYFYFLDQLPPGEAALRLQLAALYHLDVRFEKIDRAAADCRDVESLIAAAQSEPLRVAAGQVESGGCREDSCRRPAAAVAVPGRSGGCQRRNCADCVAAEVCQKRR